MEVAQGRNKFMTSTFTPFLIYLRYKNSVIWPVCFPNKHFYLQQIKSRPTSCGTGTSQSPSGEHRPQPSAASHEHGGKSSWSRRENPTPLLYNQILWWSSILSFNHSPQLHTDSISVPAKWLLGSQRPQVCLPTPRKNQTWQQSDFLLLPWNPPKQLFPLSSLHSPQPCLSYIFW